METHFCDRLRSCDRLRLSAIVSDPAIMWKVQTYHIIFLILTHDSTLLSRKARMFSFVFNMAGFEHGNVTNEEFMEEVARYECVYNRNSKNFKEKNKKANSWQKIGEKFNLSAAEAEVKLRNIRTTYGRSLFEAVEDDTFWIKVDVDVDANEMSLLNI